MLQALVAKKWSAPPWRRYGADECNAAAAASIRDWWLVPLHSPIEYDEYSKTGTKNMEELYGWFRTILHMY